MHKYEVLRHCAEEFRLQLEKYAKEDLEHKSELEWFIRQWMPLYEKVMRKEVRIPDYDYQLSSYFTNPDLSRMAETYHYKNLNHPLGVPSKCPHHFPQPFQAPFLKTRACFSPLNPRSHRAFHLAHLPHSPIF